MDEICGNYIYSPIDFSGEITFAPKAVAGDVEKVVYNDPATIVIWNDGTKTVVKCHEGDVYDPEKGFLLCCAKKLFGNKGRYNDVMREHVFEPLSQKATGYDTARDAIARSIRKLIAQELVDIIGKGAER